MKRFLLLFSLLFFSLQIFGQGTYPANQITNPINTYAQNNTKGVWVLGSGAPSFTPNSKKSHFYFDYTAQVPYFWNGSAWVSWPNISILNSTGQTQTANMSHNGGSFDFQITNWEDVLLGSETFGITTVIGNIVLKTNDDDYILLTNNQGGEQLQLGTFTGAGSVYTAERLLLSGDDGVRITTLDLDFTNALPTNNSPFSVMVLDGGGNFANAGQITLATLAPLLGVGISTLNGLADADQTFDTGTSGTDVNWSSAAGVHTLHQPNASATARGPLTSADWTKFNSSWLKGGNAGTTAGTDYIGTSDNIDVVFKRNNVERMRISTSVIEVDGLKIADGSEALNRKLTSDASGNATWTDEIPPNVQVFTSSGTYTPSAGMMYCKVQVQAGGGGGGGTTTTVGGEASIGLPGGGGAYSEGFFTYTSIGASQTITIGAAGSAGATGGNGGAGGNSSIGTLIVCVGGSGGNNIPNNSGVIGGVGAAGGTATTAGNLYSVNGGRGTISSSTARFAGNGGKSHLGNGGIGQSNAGAASASDGFGAGGAGTYIGASTSGAAGNAGTAGKIIITEYF